MGLIEPDKENKKTDALAVLRIAEYSQRGTDWFGAIVSDPVKSLAGTTVSF